MLSRDVRLSGLFASAVAAVALSFLATAYGPPWDSLNGGGRTATGIQLAAAPTGSPGPYIVAVDPSVVPLGSKLRACPNPFGDCSIVFQAEDTGGAIKGNRLDFLDMRGRSTQLAWGRRPTQVTVLPGSTPNTTTVSRPPTGVTASSSSPSSGAGDSSTIPGPGSPEWAKLLLTGALVILGLAFLRQGGKRALSGQKGAGDGNG